MLARKKSFLYVFLQLKMPVTNPVTGIFLIQISGKFRDLKGQGWNAMEAADACQVRKEAHFSGRIPAKNNGPDRSGKQGTQCPSDPKNNLDFPENSSGKTDLSGIYGLRPRPDRSGETKKSSALRSWASHWRCGSKHCAPGPRQAPERIRAPVNHRRARQASRCRRLRGCPG